MAEGWLWVSTLKQTSYSSSNRTTPALSAKTLTSQSSSRSLRRLEDRLLEQVVDRPRPRTRSGPGASCASSARSRSGRASPARSRSGRGRASAKWAWIGLHLGEAEVELARPGSAATSACVVHARGSARRSRSELVGVPLAEPVERQRADDGLLDGVVGQDALDQAGQGVGRARRRGRCGSSGRPRRAKPRSRRTPRALSASGSVTPGLGRTWTTVPDGSPSPHRVGWKTSRRPGRPARVRDAVRARRAAELPFDQEPARGRDPPGAREAQLGGLAGDAEAFGVVLGFRRGEFVSARA